jgi:hypothetical protein
MSAPSRKSYRVVVIEWLSHKAIIDAESPLGAENTARALWATNGECQVFSFEESGIDGVVVEELLL